jgi:hypothetical protein
MPGSTGFTWATAETLTSFLAQIQPLAVADREVIVEQAILLLSNYYVHLPVKEKYYNIDPIGNLKNLQENLSNAKGDRLFHDEMCRIFSELRDLHTQYSLPGDYQKYAALLPFKVGVYCDDGKARYIVTDVQETYTPPDDCADFGVGAEVLTWNGLPIGDAVAAAADRTGGASEAARRARGLAAMTIRPMERQPPPDQTDVTITYRTADSERQLTCEWRVVEVALEQHDASLAHFTNLDHEGEIRRQASKQAYRPQVIAAEKNVAAGAPQQPYPDSGAVESLFPSIFHARAIAGTQVGYIRIFSFNVPTEDPDIEVLTRRFTGEFVRLLELMPPAGLILDVRGNGGGFMPMAEAILQTLTPNTITPQPLQLRATPAVVALSKTARDLADYAASLEAAGAAYSIAIPMSKPEWCNDIGQKYFGPVVLIVDARCYSATDAFAAGFQDHDIGKILGTSSSTGAGGANVWKLSEFPAVDGSGLVQPQPLGPSLRVALRRTLRVGPRAGIPVEDIGVVPDALHAVTCADLLEEDRDLLAHAVEMLEEKT